MKKVYFSIIIPSLNEEDNLPILLDSISKQNINDFEVIIADNLSADQTKKRCLEYQRKIPHFRFIEKKCRNAGATRNYGATFAQGKYHIFFDADVKIENNFLEEIKKKILRHKLDALTVWNRPLEPSWRGKVIFSMMNAALTTFQKTIPAANGPCIIIKKDVFKKIKGFDEDIVYCEDFDLIQRAAKQKIRFAVFANPKLYVSTRRFDKEGIRLTINKAAKGVLHQVFIGPVKKKLFDYEMGGQYYKSEKSSKS